MKYVILQYDYGVAREPHNLSRNQRVRLEFFIWASEPLYVDDEDRFGH